MQSPRLWYILDDEWKVVGPVDFETLDKWIRSKMTDGMTYDQANALVRRVDRTETEFHSVSTVFLMLDHSFMSPTPVVFETMIFTNEYCPNTTLENECWRYETYDEALAGHQNALEVVKLHELEIKRQREEYERFLQEEAKAAEPKLVKRNKSRIVH